MLRVIGRVPARLATAATVVALGSAVIASGARAAALPDGRSYELVSPSEKGGGDIVGNATRVRVAEDGSAVAFVSLAGFSDTVGGGTVTEYMSIRTPGEQGWRTHAISPPQSSLSFSALLGGIFPIYQGEFSPDLSTAVMRAWRPLTADPNVANVTNLYVRRDLRTRGAGTYELLTACSACSSPLPQLSLFSRPIYIDASPDLQQFLFESPINLTSDAAGFSGKLYEWDRGTVRLVGVLPDGTAASSSGAGAGTTALLLNYTHHVISADGRRIFFAASGDLYMRLNGATTVKLNESEATTPDSPQSAKYWDASVDGSRVFFTSSEALTDDAPISGDNKLYMYDTGRAPGEPHNLTFLSADHVGTGTDVRGVVGASADGKTLYFITASQIVSGGPAVGEAALFSWHDGDVRYISDLTAGEIAQETDNASSSLGGKTARLNPNGDLIFTTTLPIGPTGYDQGHCGNLGLNSGCQEIYVYSATTHVLRCVSCNPNGAPATADANPGGGTTSGAFGPERHLSRAITDDGRRVFFSTAEALVSEDSNGRSDAYEYDVPSGTVHLISSGTDPSDSYFMDASANGDDVVFATRARLVGWDRDQSYDLYDARVRGGVPDPVPAAPACNGDTCQGTPSGIPDSAPAGSALVGAAGDLPGKLPKRKALPRPTRCRRGHVRHVVRGEVRCVKRVKRAHRRQRASKRHASVRSVAK